MSAGAGAKRPTAAVGNAGTKILQFHLQDRCLGEVLLHNRGVTPERLHEHAGWPKWRFGPSSRTGASCLAGRMAISDGPVRHFLWRVIDNLDYSLTLTKLRILDALMGRCRRCPKINSENGIASS